jgi:hypothetical protein
MENPRELRKKLGNGHWAWLANQSFSWAYVKKLGSVWNSGAPEEVVDFALEMIGRLQITDLTSNLQFCKDIKAEFERSALDSLNYTLEDRNPWSWTLRAPFAAQLVGYLRQGFKLTEELKEAIDSTAVSTSRLWYTNYHVWNCGSQVFQFSYPLAAKLLLTDPGRVLWKDLHLPFPAFALQIPTGLIDLFDPSTGAHPLDTFLVVNGRTDDEERLFIMCMAAENDESETIGDDCIFHLSLTPKHPEETIEEVVGRTIDIQDEKGLANIARVGDKDNLEAAKQLPLFVFSLLLYLASHPEDRVKYANPEVRDLHNKLRRLKGKKGQAARQRLKQIAKEPRPYLVGTKVTIDSRLKRVAEALGKGKRHHVHVASYVRGHHKMQPCGVGRTERKLIWIEPYWRGLESPTKTQKTYLVT